MIPAGVSKSHLHNEGNTGRVRCPQQSLSGPGSGRPRDSISTLTSLADLEVPYKQE